MMSRNEYFYHCFIISLFIYFTTNGETYVFEYMCCTLTIQSPKKMAKGNRGSGIGLGYGQGREGKPVWFLSHPRGTAGRQ